jgi:hypothetical protein
MRPVRYRHLAGSSAPRCGLLRVVKTGFGHVAGVLLGLGVAVDAAEEPQPVRARLVVDPSGPPPGAPLHVGVLFEIDGAGTVVRAGAIDSDPRGSGGEGVTSYVAAVLDEAPAGRPVTTVETTPYGGSVKYAKQPPRNPGAPRP